MSRRQCRVCQRAVTPGTGEGRYHHACRSVLSNTVHLRDRHRPELWDGTSIGRERAARVALYAARAAAGLPLFTPSDDSKGGAA